MKISTKKRLALFATCSLSFVLGAFVWHEAEVSPITLDIVHEAQKIIGIEFTQPHADSMLTTLDNQARIYQTLRELKLPNSTVPALNFNPVPVGFTTPDKA